MADAGIDQSLITLLGAVRFEVAQLGGPLLGLADAASRRVLIDTNAAGYGWFADVTPLRDEEFVASATNSTLTAAPGSLAQGKMDLLSVVLHEMGHIAGLGDISGDPHGNNLMIEALASGSRRTQEIDVIFANWRQNGSQR